MTCRIRRLSDYGLTLNILYFNMVTVPHEMVGVERMSDYRGVRLQRFNVLSNIY